MSRMKLKSPKKKRKSNIIIYSLIIYGFFSFTFYSCLKDNKGINNEEFIKFLLKGGNIEEIKYNNFSTIVNKSFNYLLDIDLSKPKTLLNKTIFKEDDKISLNKSIKKSISLGVTIKLLSLLFKTSLIKDILYSSFNVPIIPSKFSLSFSYNFLLLIFSIYS